MTSTSLFYCCDRCLLIYGWLNTWMNTWMVRKNLTKHHFLKKKKDFYSHLNMEDITDADYTPRQRGCQDFETKKLPEYH